MKKTFLSIAIIVVVAMILWLVLGRKSEAPVVEQNNIQNTVPATTDNSSTTNTQDANATLGTSVYQDAGSNPVQNIPETNTFKTVDTNPYSQGYVNPFK